MTRLDLKGVTPDNWNCIDCGVNTAPGIPSRAEFENAFAADVLRVKQGVEYTVDEHYEIYHVRDSVWKAAGIEPMGGCLCIGCLEKRLGRELRPKDFARSHPFNQMPGTDRLMERRGDATEIRIDYSGALDLNHHMPQIDNVLRDAFERSPTGGEGTITLAGIAHRFTYTRQGKVIELKIAAVNTEEVR